MNADKNKTSSFLSAFICVHLRFLLLVLIPVGLYANSSNPPTATTGGYSEPTCVQCHAGSLNPSGGSLAIGSPVSYSPGALYAIPMQIQDSSATVFGYELSARFLNGSQAGTFASNAAVSVRTASSGGFPVQYAANAGIIVQGISILVNWTAPPDAAGGEVVFSAAAVAASSAASTPVGHTYVAASRATSGPPQINANGVVSAASYQPQTAAGQLITIFGQGLTTGGPYAAGALPLPTALGPTRVSFSGILAPLVYVSSTQINAQAPLAFFPGPVSMGVLVNSLVGATFTVTIAASAPAIFTTDASGSGPGAILHSDYGLVTSSRPAKAGETVLIFATGLGPVNPGVNDGAPAPGFTQTVMPVTVTIGGKAAIVKYSGLAPGFAGLDQINAVVPDGLSGIVEVTATAGTVTSPGGVTIQLQ